MVEEIAEMPVLATLMRRAVTGAIGRTVGPRSGPPRRAGGEARALDNELLVRDVAIDVDHLGRYARVCGFRLSNVLPPTYPHVVAFPLALELMTRADFPFALFGLVHIQNTIEHLRPVAVSETLDVTVRADSLREHDRGRAIDLVTSATVDNEAVWRERSTYLRKSASGGGSTGERADPPPATAVWRVPASTGSAYAAVSGDRNPIHTSTAAARLFGFRRRIAHGMWTKARCLAAFEGQLPEAYTVDVSFKLPISLPASVAFSASRAAAGGWQFALHDAGSNKPHLAGLIETS